MSTCCLQKLTVGTTLNAQDRRKKWSKQAAMGGMWLQAFVQAKLTLMNEEDLKQMGIKKGPRMKLIKALGLGATAAKEEL